MSRNIILILALTFFSLNLFALPHQTQQQKNDSLLTIYHNKSENDSLRLDAFFEYAKNFRKTNPDTTLLLADELLEKIHKWTVGDAKKHFVALTHYLKGNASTNLKDYKRGEFHFNERLSIEQDRNSKLGLANAFMSFGWFYYLQRDYTTSKKWYSKILDVSNYPREKEKKAIAYKSIGLCFYYSAEYDSALIAWQNESKLREELGKKKELAQSYYNIGLLYQRFSDFPIALVNFDKSLNLRKEIADEKGILNSSFKIGGILIKLGQFDKALEVYFRAIKICDEIDDNYWRSAVYNGIGNLYLHSKNYEEALRYYQKCLEISEGTLDEKSKAQVYNNIAGVYQKIDNYDEALRYHKKNLKIRRKINDEAGLASTYNNLGTLYYDLDSNNKAIINYNFALNLKEKLNLKSEIPSSYINLGLLYNDLKRYKTGLKRCRIAHNLSVEIELLAEQKAACSCLSEAYQALGNYQKAYEYQQQYYELKDSLFNEEKTKELTRLEMNYAFEQEQDSLAAVQRELDLKNEAKLEKAEATRNYSIGGFGAAAILAVLMYSRFSMSSKKNAIIQAEKERSEALLLNILPEETALELKEKGVVQAQHHDEVTVLFADITNFTQLSERVPPQELVATIHTYFSAFDQIMEKHDIEKIKTIGDAYMAASGLQNKPEQAKRMVQAAQEMMAYVQEHPLSEDINFRVGIHTGPVVSGVVGVKKFAYDIWGDTVNTAARMESASEPGRINISEATQEKIKDYFEHTSRGKVAIKGKGEMEMFFVNTNTPQA